MADYYSFAQFRALLAADRADFEANPPPPVNWYFNRRDRWADADEAQGAAHSPIGASRERKRAIWITFMRQVSATEWEFRPRGTRNPDLSIATRNA